MILYMSITREASRADSPIKPGANINPADYPILAKHYGIEPMQAQRLGPRVLAELPAEVATKRGIAAGIEREVARYDALGGS